MRLTVPPSTNVDIDQNLRTEWKKQRFQPNATTESRKADRADRQFVNDEMLSRRMDPPGWKGNRLPTLDQTPTRDRLRDFDPLGEARVAASNLSRGSPKQNRIITQRDFRSILEQVARELQP